MRHRDERQRRRRQVGAEAAPTPLTVLVAPDSFKGTLTAREAATSIAAGVRQAAPDASVTMLPMADGGEGSLDALTDGWKAIEQQTVDAVGRAVLARWAVSGEGRTAVVELAQASGLPGVDDGPLRPEHAGTDGTGRLLVAALDAGVAEIVLCLGGSASSDGGAGILRALGARIRDDRGDDVPVGGGGLARVASLDLSALHPRARAVRWRLAVDVTNPLLGPRGAAAVFGPQKGADAAAIRRLDDALSRWADVLATATGVTVRDLPGSGAAGGVPAALIAVCRADLVPGARLVAESIGLPAALAQADLVLTGEGSFDPQSLDGKVVGAIGDLAARSAHRPVVVLAGRTSVATDRARAAGITAAFALARANESWAEQRARTPERLRTAAADVVRRFVARPDAPFG